MKDQYVGDINDFFKYSILETIEKTLNKKILVVWMLTKSEGMDIGYSHCKKYNEPLYSRLQKIVSSNKREVKAIEEIYKNYIYHSDFLEKRTRAEYFNDVEKKSNTIDVIFFDPDKGISYNNIDKDIEHLYWDEINRFWKLGKDLLIYQHFRRQKWDEYITELKKHIKHDLEGAFLVPIKTKNVMFLYISHKDIKERLKDSFIDWKDLIEII